MFNKKEIEKLAKLSRITLSGEEAESLSKEFSKIVDYVSILQRIEVEENDNLGIHINIMREDGEPHKKGEHTENILKEAPETQNSYIKVNKVLNTEK